MFNGRYGNDKLNKTLIISAVVLSLLGIIFSWIFPQATVLYGIFYALSMALLIVSIVRMFSRNYVARQKELQKYLVLENRIRAWWQRIRKKTRNAMDIDELRNYKHVNCPQCMQKLRVPRGKGRIRVTCSKCNNKFVIKS